jgi:pimeloyl-ACP methyl ester carboxylesterase
MPDRQFRSGEISLRYRDEGAGPAVVFLHGWTLDLELWDAQAAALGDSMRVLRLDRRGFGLSGGTPDARADAGDVVALLDHLQVPRAAVVGMSQGARAALATAQGVPHRVTALVLDGPPDCFSAGDGEADADLSMQPFRELVRTGGLDAFRRAWRVHPLMRLHGGDPAAQAALDGMLARYPGRDLTGPAPAAAAAVDAASLARLALPVLILGGQHDTPARIRAADALARALPGAGYRRIPGAGHLANLDNPAAYNDELRAFFRRQSRVAA